MESRDREEIWGKVEKRPLDSWRQEQCGECAGGGTACFLGRVEAASPGARRCKMGACIVAIPLLKHMGRLLTGR